MSRRVLLRFAATLIAAAFMAAAPAEAQPAPPSAPSLPDGMTASEFQSLGCMAGGTVVALGALAYVEVIAVAAAVGTPTTLLVPVLATGFVVGCSVGAAMAPGLWWIYRRL